MVVPSDFTFWKINYPYVVNLCLQFEYQGDEDDDEWDWLREQLYETTELCDIEDSCFEFENDVDINETILKLIKKGFRYKTKL